MQSCPKNVHTGPLTGDSKRSSHIPSSIAKDSLPLPPVALALPLEAVSATGPPSPARGSAGMPPPPSPAGATYQPTTPAPKQELESPPEKQQRRKPRIGKTMVRNNIAANFPENTMLLMCHQPQGAPIGTDTIHHPNGICVKRELESPPKENLRSPEVVKEEEQEKREEQFEPVLKTEQPEYLEPFKKTVAEVVKVRNMKRKLSITKDLDKPPEVVPLVLKKPKLEPVQLVQAPQLRNNGSYKDLIKKDVPCFKINNGKRKLILNTEQQKLSPSKNESTKRVKTTKSLTTAKHNSKAEQLDLPTIVNNSKVNDSVERTIDCVATTTVGKSSSKKGANTAKSKKKLVAALQKTKKKTGSNLSAIVVKIPKRQPQAPKWSNGWKWEGEPYEAKVFLNVSLHKT